MLIRGIFPDMLKIVKLMPIFKKEQKTLFTNYKPILQLTSIFKIFGKNVFRQLYQFY